MSTKGASNRYGNAGNGNRGHATIHTGFPWAKDFDRSTLNWHNDEHMKSLGFSSKEEYRAHAVSFANRVDRTNGSNIFVQDALSIVNHLLLSS